MTYENQKILEAAGMNPIPVFHLGSDEKWLKRYLRQYEYIALGGLIPNPTVHLVPIMDRLFHDLLVDKQGFPKVKLHAFACTSPLLLIRYPFFSTDSATARKLAFNGNIYLPQALNPKKFVAVKISCRDVPIYLQHPQIILKKIDLMAIKVGLTLTQLAEDYMARMLFNHLYLSDIVKQEIPEWPWSMSDRKSSPKAEEHLNFYLAGNMSKKEESWFWTEICKRQSTQAIKKRLHSFYYEDQVRHLISLKLHNVESPPTA